MGSHVDPLGYLMGCYGFLLGSYRDEATSHHTTRLSTRAVWGLRRCNSFLLTLPKHTPSPW